MNLHHAYHLYADGDWRQGWEEHLKALSKGLQSELTTFVVGIVGHPDRRAQAYDTVTAAGASVVVERNSGFEQETLDWVDAFVDTCDGYMLYTHSKGAGYPTHISTPWRRTMTYDVVIEWRQCLFAMSNGADCVGTSWHEAGPLFGTVPYWAGNFWWASHSFLRKLPPPSRENRFGAEGWIGSGGPVIPYPMRPGTFPPATMSEDWVYV